MVSIKLEQIDSVDKKIGAKSRKCEISLQFPELQFYTHQFPPRIRRGTSLRFGHGPIGDRPWPPPPQENLLPVLRRSPIPTGSTSWPIPLRRNSRLLRISTATVAKLSHSSRRSYRIPKESYKSSLTYRMKESDHPRWQEAALWLLMVSIGAKTDTWMFYHLTGIGLFLIHVRIIDHQQEDISMQASSRLLHLKAFLNL